MSRFVGRSRSFGPLPPEDQADEVGSVSAPESFAEMSELLKKKVSIVDAIIDIIIKSIPKADMVELVLKLLVRTKVLHPAVIPIYEALKKNKDAFKCLQSLLKLLGDLKSELKKKLTEDNFGPFIDALIEEVIQENPQLLTTPVPQMCNELKEAYGKIGQPVSLETPPTIHPQDKDELIQIIKEANREGSIVRVVGDQHSFPHSIIFATAGNRKCINLVLDSAYFQTVVEWPSKENSHIVKVRSGMHIGTNTNIPLQDRLYELAQKAGVHTQYKTLVTSQNVGTLTPQLWQRGYALPDLGGIDHQTVGGFLSTGSSGGSSPIKGFSLWNAIQSITLIDGEGNEKILTRPPDSNPNDEFWAAGVSLGLLGVIVEVAFKVVPHFNIKGQQATCKVTQWDVNFTCDPTVKGKPMLDEYFRQKDYSRILWYPQPNLDKLTIWEAERVDPTPEFETKPYVELPINPKYSSDISNVVTGPMLQHLMAVFMTFYDRLKNMKDLFVHLGLPILASAFMDSANWLYSWLLDKVFISDQKGSDNTFQDYAWRVLPMDNTVLDNYIKVQFTELWIPLDKTSEVMQKLDKHFKSGGFDASGYFCFEFYAAEKSDFWLSPSFGTDVIRVDVFWLAWNQERPETFFQQFWDLLEPFNFRPHWGKYIPKNFSKSVERLYPKWNEFKELRKLYDPKDIFLTDYWSAHTGIQQRWREAPTMLPPPKQFDTRTLPLRNAIEQGGAVLVEKPATIKDVLDILRKAADHNLRVKAVGTEYSYGEVAYAPLLINLSSNLNSILGVPQDIRPGEEKESFIKVQAGATIEQINDYLWPITERRPSISGKRPNAKGYRVVPVQLSYAQLSVGGVISVGAHSTGMNLKPFCDYVVSMTFAYVDSEKQPRLVVLEPTEGVTDKNAFMNRYQGTRCGTSIELIQDDAQFDAALVSFGTLGVLVEVILKTEPAFFSRVHREKIEWKEEGRQKINDLWAACQLQEDKEGHIDGFMLFVPPYDIKLKRNRQKDLDWFKRVVCYTWKKVSEDEIDPEGIAPLGLALHPTFSQILTDFQIGVTQITSRQQPSASSLNLTGIVDQIVTNILALPSESIDTTQDCITQYVLGNAGSISVTVSEAITHVSSGEEVFNAIQTALTIAKMMPHKELFPIPFFVQVLNGSRALLHPAHGVDKKFVGIEALSIYGYECCYDTLRDFNESMLSNGYRLHLGEFTQAKSMNLWSNYSEREKNAFREVEKKFNPLHIFSNRFSEELTEED